MFVYIYSSHVMTVCTRLDICSSSKVKAGEGTQTELPVLAKKSLYEN